MAPAASVPLGLALLTADRIRMDLGGRDAPVVGVAGAYAVGLADASVATAGRIARSAGAVGRGPASVAANSVRAILRQPAVARVSPPARRLVLALAERAQGTVLRGRTVAAEARVDALAFLRTESAIGLSWVRGELLPVVIDDLVADPKVRELVVEQAHGVLADAAREVRQRSVSADARVEMGFRRLFGAGRHELAP